MNHSTSTKARRFGANLAALAVGGVAATATWHHIAAVGAKYGESMSAFLPVSIDGMMVAGVLLAADAKAAGRLISPWARVATWAGGVLSIAAQIESGRARGPVAAAIATVFSLTLIITVEALFHRSKPAQTVVAPRTAADPVPVHPVAAVLAEKSVAPTSPAPQVRPMPVRTSVRRGPHPRREMISPLTGKTMQI